MIITRTFENKNYKNPFKEELDKILNDEYKSETIKVVEQSVVKTLKNKKVRKFFKLAEQVANEVKKNIKAKQ